jgi:hypothetical protein
MELGHVGNRIGVNDKSLYVLSLRGSVSDRGNLIAGQEIATSGETLLAMTPKEGIFQTI